MLWLLLVVLLLLLLLLLLLELCQQFLVALLLLLQTLLQLEYLVLHCTKHTSSISPTSRPRSSSGEGANNHGIAKKVLKSWYFWLGVFIIVNS